jgi:hypothetical protein
LETFSQLFVYSSGTITPEALKMFKDNYAAVLSDPKTNDLFRVPYYMAAGETNVALPPAQRVMGVINANGHTQLLGAQFGRA